MRRCEDKREDEKRGDEIIRVNLIHGCGGLYGNFFCVAADSLSIGDAPTTTTTKWRKARAKKEIKTHNLWVRTSTESPASLLLVVRYCVYKNVLILLLHIMYSLILYVQCTPSSIVGDFSRTIFTSSAVVVCYEVAVEFVIRVNVQIQNTLEIDLKIKCQMWIVDGEAN